MKMVALEYTYNTDIISVPECIANELKKIQALFDEWLYDKNNDHGCWIIQNGEKMAISFETQDFINFLNNHVLSNSDMKAFVVKKSIINVPGDIPILYF